MDESTLNVLMRDNHYNFFDGGWENTWLNISYGFWSATAVDVYMNCHVFTPDLEEWLGI